MVDTEQENQDGPAERTEQELIETAQVAVSRCNWLVGECAAEWTKRYARGRTDADFARLVGLSSDQVYQRRRVWETFSDVFEEYASLRWSHFYVALNWDDAAECLQWAEENEATVADLRAWRRLSHGEEEEQEPPADAFAGDPSIAHFPTIPTEVRVPNDDPESLSTRLAAVGVTSGEGFESPELVGAVNRISDGGDNYAPFRADAGSPPPGESSDSPVRTPPTADKLISKMASTLERFTEILSPEMLDSLQSQPESKRLRLRKAISEFVERTGDLG
ncbi:helix-turn-helix domain-containing protein [Calycomorphotria hydatis]|uniref:Uncharacterized protein n=1 Tax=Calycomorphotria hydatis TaxID=2528027 RepID=A0A517TC52_9PLAN|nr:helix-turn-helix domain-containing protein [Calycomorphotria hydatis]QDT65943.1 hypothetical protein V22_32060 [Calycomorphotria hydatis]